MNTGDSGAIRLDQRNDVTAKVININALRNKEKEKQSAACLVMIAGEDIGRRFALGRKPLTIGRSSDCDIELQDSTLSRRHCMIGKSRKGVLLKDLNSTNHTYVNGDDITARTLNSGDHIRIGNTHFKFFNENNAEQVYLDELYRLMTSDSLTGALNRRAFERELARYHSLFQRHGTPLSLIMMDVDHFKQINDTYGHLAGDKILAGLGKIIKTFKRDNDVFCRYGGEEFALLCPQTPIHGALQTAQRLRQRILKHAFRYKGENLNVTLSFGVAQLSASIDRKQFVHQADTRLYMAKRQGRNRIVPAGVD